MRLLHTTVAVISMMCFTLMGHTIETYAQDQAADTGMPILKHTRLITPQGHFAGKKNKTAEDLSGIACMPPTGAGERLCLLVNDESTSAQFAMLQGDQIKPALVVGLIGEAPSEATLGTKPSVPCPQTGQFEEFDGEAVTFAESYFYVVGSHGCSRKQGEFRLSSFHLARVRVDATGQLMETNGQIATDPQAAGVVELTYRLSDVLQRVPEIQPYFGQSLNDAKGLNIEGIAVTTGQLWVGLRAPSIAGNAFLIGATIDDLYAPGHGPSQAVPMVMRLPVGPDIGVRDLTTLHDGRLLVLAGPVQEQNTPFSLWLVDPRSNSGPRLLGNLEDVNDGDTRVKAEGITVLDDEANGLTVLVIFDGLKNGGPREYRIPLQ